MTTDLSSAFAEITSLRQACVEPGVETFAAALQDQIADESPDVRASVQSCINVLQQGGKRLRGVLAITGYQLYGGTDLDEVGRAAGAIEGVHTHLLVMDDVHDRATRRRNTAAAHECMRRHFEGRSPVSDASHLGRNTAQTAGHILHSKAQSTLLGLALPNAYKVRAGIILNDCLVETGIGQLRDIAPPDYDDFDPAEILETARLKTARYSLAMPLQIGAALAGATADDMHHFEAYTDNAGIAFQLRDDVLGLVGKEEVTGKPQKSDIMEGKKTWIMATALERAGKSDRAILYKALGDTALSDNMFDHCLTIIRNTGALDEAGRLIDGYIDSALAALDAAPQQWPRHQVQILRAIAVYGAHRQH